MSESSAHSWRSNAPDDRPRSHPFGNPPYDHCERGTPLGRLRFQKETGIRKHEWTRFWGRWSEAVRDAGHAVTNQFTVAIPDATLIERLADYVRELDRFRVRGLRNMERDSQRAIGRLGVEWALFGIPCFVTSSMWSLDHRPTRVVQCDRSGTGIPIGPRQSSSSRRSLFRRAFLP